MPGGNSGDGQSSVSALVGLSGVYEQHRDARTLGPAAAARRKEDSWAHGCHSGLHVGLDDVALILLSSRDKAY